MAKSVFDVLVCPLITEKSSSQIEKRKYTFQIAEGVNRLEVKDAVEEIFKVKVEDVNLINGVRKFKCVGRHEGMKPRVRKAIVTLKPGFKLDVFEV